MTRLAIRDLAVERAGRRLVERLDLAVPAGRFLAVVGPSGVGKSSLLATLAGLLAPAAGDVRYHGDGPARPPAAFRPHLGLVFQHLRLTLNATARTNVLCGLLGQRPWWRTLAGFGSADRAHARDWLARLELGAYERTPVARLSGGERQRVALARALIAEPAVILADEPVANLDPALARRVLALLRAETRAHGRTVICVLHDPDLVAEFADATLALHRDHPAGWTHTESAPR